ncbi:MAG TPA: endolytic transglycosylase MltG, partial [Prevotella sp.]|nr:endolytic transglycosylase MltG [Prevotella sp.]
FTVFRHIKNGQQTSVNLTIPEVKTMDRLAGALSRKLMMDSATVAQAFANEDFCRKYGYDTATIAALFIPNTYDIYWNVSLDRLMERMQKEYKVFWNRNREEKAKAMGLTPVEVATMASIVDEETANNQEKPMIAGMYYNRLKADMPLQADPTIKYAWKNFTLRRIYNNLLYIKSPYNTYKNTGLPPGPIKIASIKGIDAVLNHVHHDYLYMCAKEDFAGTHNFAKTYEEHLQNAAKYSKALNERGIK